MSSSSEKTGKSPGRADFTVRRWMPELMDDPEGNTGKLYRTLEQFRVINTTLARIHAPLRRLVLDDMTPGTPRTLLDIGAGGGDIDRRLIDESRRRGLSLRITCIDPDHRVAEFCRRQCTDYPEIDVQAISDTGTEGEYDYVFSNHVLHHLTDDEVHDFLNRVFERCRRRAIISDLERSAWSHALFGLLAGLVFRNSFSREDGRRSLRKAFRLEELERIVPETKWGARTQMRRRFPAHLLIVGEKTSSGPL